MVGTSALFYHDDYLKYQFGPFHPFQPIREKLTLDTLSDLTVFDESALLLRPRPAAKEILELVHSKKYIDYVEQMCEKGKGTLDTGDTPATQGLFQGSQAAVGGSVDAAIGIAEGKFQHAFNPGGGLHHAHPNYASGFCVFNDIAIAARTLQKKFDYKRIAMVDVDGHHGDGTQDIFYHEPLLTISLHRYGFRFYPGSGSDLEVGEGKGKGYCVNVPLPEHVSDDQYVGAYEEVVLPALKAYEPEIIIHQFGADSHFTDPLVGLSLTTHGYQRIADLTHKAAHQLCDGKYLVVGGGGYNIDSVRRIWSIMFCTISEINGKRVDELHDDKSPQSSTQAGEIVTDVVERLKENSLPLLQGKKATT